MRCAVPASGSPLPRDPLERLDQPADHPQLAPAEPGVRRQLGVAGHVPRQDREGRLHRLDEGRVGQAGRDRRAVFGVEHRAGQRHVGADLLHHLPCMQLVLAGEHRLGPRPGQAGPLGDERGGQRAELLVMRHHTGPASSPRTTGLRGGEALEIEADEASVARKAEEIEAGAVETLPPAEAVVCQRVPVVVEQQADAAGVVGVGGGCRRHRCVSVARTGHSPATRRRLHAAQEKGRPKAALRTRCRPFSVAPPA